LVRRVHFDYIPFVLGPIRSADLETSESQLSLRLSPLRNRVDVGVVDPNIHTEMSLLEHILLNMDFNYLDTVPESKRMQLRLPDI